MSTIQEIGNREDFYQLREETEFLVVLFYANEDEKKYSEFFAEFEKQSKAYPEAKFVKVNQKSFSIKQERIRPLGIDYQEEKKKTIYLFHSSNLMASYYYSIPLLKANVPRLLGKPAPELNSRVTTVAEFENTLKKNKCVIASFNFYDEMTVEKYLNGISEVHFVTIDKSVFNQNEEEIGRFNEIEEESKENFSKFKISSGSIYIFKEGELKNSMDLITERKTIKAVYPIIGKEIPALEEGFIEDLALLEKSIKEEKLVALFILRSKEDSAKFVSAKKHFPEIKIFYSIYYDSQDIVKKYATYETHGRFGSRMKVTVPVKDNKLPALILFKNGEKKNLLEEAIEYVTMKSLSLLVEKPVPKVDGYAVSLEDFENIIKENKYVYCYGYNKFIYKGMEKKAKQFSEVKVVKVELEFLESVNKKYFNDEKEKDVHAFFRNGTLIEQIHKTDNKLERDRITERTFLKNLYKLVEKPVPKPTDGSIDDYEEFKSIIEKNKIVLVSFQSVDDHEYDSVKIVYKALSNNPENKDVKFIYLMEENILDFVGKPLVPEKLYNFYIYVDGKIVYDKDYDYETRGTVALQREINKILGKKNNEDDILNLDEYEKFVKNNEFVIIVFHDNFDENNEILTEYHKIKKDEKYKKVKFLEFNTSESGVSKIHEKLGGSRGNKSGSVYIRNGILCQDDFMGAEMKKVIMWANYFCGYEKADFILEQTRYEQALKENEKMIIYLGEGYGSRDEEGDYALKKLNEQVPKIKVYKMYWLLITTSENNLHDFDEYGKNFGFTFYKKGAKVKFIEYPIRNEDKKAYIKDIEKIIPEIKAFAES